MKLICFRNAAVAFLTAPIFFSPHIMISGNLYAQAAECHSTEVEEIDDILQSLRAQKYQPIKQAKSQYRDYENSPLRVRWFYLQQHSFQTLDLSQELIANFDDIMGRALHAKRSGDHKQLQKMVTNKEIILADPMSMLFKLESFLDKSDPDISLGNAYHGFQAAEEMRLSLENNQNVSAKELLQGLVVGLFHDVGKVLAAEMNFPQWLVVGDTYPVGVPFDKSIVLKKMSLKKDLQEQMLEHPAFSALAQSNSEKASIVDSFALCPDSSRIFNHPEFGIYTPGAGMDQFIMAFGHDEYAYRVFANQTSLKREFLHVLRFHSFYPLHSEGAYQWALHPLDQDSLKWIRIFNEFDLYSKNPVPPDIQSLRPIYQAIIDTILPREQDGSPGLLIWPILKLPAHLADGACE